MCGIVGILNLGQAGIDDGDVGMFEQLLVVDTLRGLDGTGIMAVDSKQRVTALKMGADPFTLLREEDVQNAIHGKGKRRVNALVGHNRFATRGEKNTECAHPFTQGKITLVHNGTLNSGYQLPDFSKFKVDSEALAHAIDTVGIKKVVDEKPGAYACVYFDNESKTLNFIRNDERPLWWCKFWNEKCYAFASEAGFLELIINRKYGSNMSNITSMKPHTLTTVHMKSGQITTVKMEPKIASWSGAKFYQGSGRPNNVDITGYDEYEEYYHGATAELIKGPAISRVATAAILGGGKPSGINPSTMIVKPNGEIVSEVNQVSSMQTNFDKAKTNIVPIANAVKQVLDQNQEREPITVNTQGQRRQQIVNYSGYTLNREFVFDAQDIRPSAMSKEGKEQKWVIIGQRRGLPKVTVVSKSMESNDAEYFQICGVLKGKILNMQKDVTDPDEKKHFYIMWLGDIAQVENHADSYDKDGLTQYRKEINEIMLAQDQAKREAVEAAKVIH